MTSSDRLLNRIGELKAKNTALERENTALKRKNAKLERESATLRRKLVTGNPFKCVEHYIAKLIGGSLTQGTTYHDIILPDGRRVEVKFSHLNKPHDHTGSHRWQWRNLLGINGGKKYHQLILVGVVDSQHRRFYDDSRSPYVIFDIPFRCVKGLMNREGKMIQISTNPESVASETAQKLFEDFQVTRCELKASYQRI